MDSQSQFMGSWSPIMDSTRLILTISGELGRLRARGEAIRSMKAPVTAYDDPALGRDPQPAHMRDYVATTDDNGGVHINSGILNHTLFLFATGLGGQSWDVPCNIWDLTLKTKLFPQAGFQDFAAATVSAAGQLYSPGSAVQSTLIDAWSEVGLPVTLARKKTRSRQIAPNGETALRPAQRHSRFSFLVHPNTNSRGCGHTPAH